MRSGAMDFKGGESELKSPVGAGGARLPAAVRRAQLLDVARRVFGRDGYRGASMESIGAEAGLPGPRARALAVAIVGMAESAATWWLAEHRPLPIADLADELAGLAWKGFARYPASTGDPSPPREPCPSRRRGPGRPAPHLRHGRYGMAKVNGSAGTNRAETSPTYSGSRTRASLGGGAPLPRRSPSSLAQMRFGLYDDS